MDDTTSVGQIGLDLVVNHSLFKAQMEGTTRIAKKLGKFWQVLLQ